MTYRNGGYEGHGYDDWQTQDLSLLDLYCCGGGGAVGYQRAGFTKIIGIDHIKKRRYPFDFIKADVLDFIRTTPREWFDQFDMIHASPPCQRYSRTKHMAVAQGNKPSSVDHVGVIQEFLRSLNIPYVIENVEGSPLENATVLCGSSFGLKVRRHRLFEASFDVPSLTCAHKTQGKPIGIYGSMNDIVKGVNSKTGKLVIGGSTAINIGEAQNAMGIDWLGWSNLKEAIPPAYTEYIGKCFRGGMK